MKRLRFLAFSAAAVFLTASTGFADTIYTSQSSFTAALKTGYDMENFSSMNAEAATESWSFAKNGFDWTASTIDYYSGDGPADNPPAILFLDDAANNVVMTPAGGSTAGAGDVLTLTFTSGNVTAIGGDFFLTDFLGNVASGSFSLTLNDGTTETFSNVSSSNFVGFISSTPITSLTFVPPTPYTAWATVDNVYVGESKVSPTPEPSTWLLLGIGLAGLVATGRRTSIPLRK